MTHGPLLYRELSSWWPLLSAPADYAEEAAYYAKALRGHSRIPIESVLELGSGGGNNASHMKQVFERLTLVDISPGMLEVSQALNPECEHHLGDMRSVRPGRLFDCVFVHDAICYATTLDDLRRVVETAHRHCRPGGAVLFAPDYVRETFRATTDHGGHDENGRGLRYLEWTWDPDPTDSTYVTDYAFLLRESDGTIEARYDRHVEGLFATTEWIDVFESAGFTARALRHEHSQVSLGVVVFVGMKE